MEIIVMRHGKPDIDTSGKVSAIDFAAWLYEYDQAGICSTCAAPAEAIERASRCHFVVCSDLPRSIESAKALNGTSPDRVDRLFRECAMPSAKWNHPKLSKSSWAVFFRALQLLGYSKNVESFSDIKIRSARCAVELSRLATQYESVLFIGHGALNWFIHKQLLGMQWQNPRQLKKQYWDYAVYTSPTL